MEIRERDKQMSFEKTTAAEEIPEQRNSAERSGMLQGWYGSHCSCSRVREANIKTDREKKRPRKRWGVSGMFQ